MDKAILNLPNLSVHSVLKEMLQQESTLPETQIEFDQYSIDKVTTYRNLRVTGSLHFGSYRGSQYLLPEPVFSPLRVVSYSLGTSEEDDKDYISCTEPVVLRPVQVSFKARVGAYSDPGSLTDKEFSHFNSLITGETIQPSYERVQRDSSKDLLEITSNDEKCNVDPNYSAYLNEAERLAEEFGECVVAYVNGKLVAIGANVTEVMENIPDEYSDENILIQKVPDRSIKIRQPIRVSKE